MAPQLGALIPAKGSQHPVVAHNLLTPVLGDPMHSLDHHGY